MDLPPQLLLAVERTVRFNRANAEIPIRVVIAADVTNILGHHDRSEMNDNRDEQCIEPDFVGFHKRLPKCTRRRQRELHAS